MSSVIGKTFSKVSGAYSNLFTPRILSTSEPVSHPPESSRTVSKVSRTLKFIHRSNHSQQQNEIWVSLEDDGVLEKVTEVSPATEEQMMMMMSPQKYQLLHGHNGHGHGYAHVPGTKKDHALQNITEDRDTVTEGRQKAKKTAQEALDNPRTTL